MLGRVKPVGVQMKPINIKVKPIRVGNPDIEVKMIDNVETGQCPVSTNETTQYKNPDIVVKMKPTGVGNTMPG